MIDDLLAGLLYVICLVAFVFLIVLLADVVGLWDSAIQFRPHCSGIVGDCR